MAEGFRLGKIRKILIRVFRLRQTSLVGPWGIESVHGVPSKAATPSSGGTLKARAIGRKRIEVCKEVLLRSVFSAAIVSAAFRAAIFSGADRGASLPNVKVWETGPIQSDFDEQDAGMFGEEKPKLVSSPRRWRPTGTGSGFSLLRE